MVLKNLYLTNCQNHVQIGGSDKCGCRSDVCSASCAGLCEHPKYLEYIAIFTKKYLKGTELNVLSDVSNSIIFNLEICRYFRKA